MKKPRFTPRRPVAWNQLLHKGHAHNVSRTALRRGQKQDLDAALEEYLDEAAEVKNNNAAED